MLFAIQLFSFFIASWLGIYLIARNIKKESLLWAGFGLLSYALLVGVSGIIPFAQSGLMLKNIQTSAVFFPTIFWTGGLFTILSEPFEIRDQMYRIWKSFVFPFSIILVVFASYFSISEGLSLTVVLIPLLFAFYFFVMRLRNRKKVPIGLLIIGTIFFSISVGLVVPLPIIPRPILISMMGLDIALMGFGIALIDAYEEGHTLKTDMRKSFIGSLITTLFFSTQVAIVAYFATSLSVLLVSLLYSSIFTAILIYAFFDFVGLGGDRWRRNQDGLRENQKINIDKRSSSLIKNYPVFQDYDFAEIERFTRRAISYLNDLSKLSTSPLINHPQINTRLEAQGAPIDTISRTQELKSLLNDAIIRLKPAGDQDFGTSDDWRYFNVLYFPYVLGLKPNRRRSYSRELSGDEKKVMDWFSQEVPDRTLYNWQTTAARLVAQQIADMEG